MTVIRNIFFLTLIFSSALFVGCSKKLPENVLNSGLGIVGHDPVSYFDNNPKKGFEELSYTSELSGITYWFFSQRNQARFASNPSKYEPQLGGWCSHAMVDGVKFIINPSVYRIIDGKLYFFYSPNVLAAWDARSTRHGTGALALIAEANKQWDKLRR